MKNQNSSKATNTIAGINDLETLLRIEEEMARYPLYHTFTKGEFRKYLSESKSTTFLLYLDNKIAGYCSFKRKNKDLAEIEGMAILEKFRHKGLGTYAMTIMLEKLKDCKEIMLVTHPENNNSLRLYLKFGFVIKEWKDNYFGKEPRLALWKIKRSK